MGVKEFLRMSNGERDTSYAQNSFNRSVISTAKPILEKAIEDLVSEGLPSNVLTIADLGCAFGPNTFTVITTIKRKVEKRCNELGVKQPELQVFLNDLPGNDFNSTFKFFFENYQQLEGERIGEDGKKCFIAGAPGSFYERVFPLNSLHLVHSCYSAHWLSRVPPGLTSEVGIPINKGKICISNTSPPPVSKAYLEQFQEDFTSFIKLRSKELIPNGRMVLILHGRQGGDPSSATCDYWELLSEALIAMVSEGLIEEEKLDSFNVPYYTASCEEIQEVIDKEGSFDTKQLVTFALDIGDKEETNMQVKGDKVAKNIRSVSEPLISHHFGHEIIEPLYEKFTCLVIDHMIKKLPIELVSIAITLQRKGWK
ncbi:probable caffeine synthase 4 [Telopea speciosissima]|uniref:probable caffeine synthase 4 n=1 Tax=Telopea speciosissima TaxID=54955 RepID=UPI001CC4C842|nr:probable caffeine synthase 4 [Telopea speciosissima]